MTSPKAKDRNEIHISILDLAKGGISKREISETLSISDQQLRRLTAELVDRGLLHLDTTGILITTDKGLIFCKNNR